MTVPKARAAFVGRDAELAALGEALALAVPREIEILRLIARGLTNREIGEALFISPKTAGVHVGTILGKLGVAGRVQAATLALHEGLVERPRPTVE